MYLNLLSEKFFDDFYVISHNSKLFNLSRKVRKLVEMAEKTIMEDEWFNVFSFIEYWVSRDNALKENNVPQVLTDTLTSLINNMFQEELVGYRIINFIVTPITDKLEVDTIEAISNNPYEEVRSHIQKALVKLSDRENPDYKNSIKESISSVEAMSKIITGKTKSGLTTALNSLESEGIKIPKLLREGITKLYNYASTEPGIRHGGINDEINEPPSQEDAQLLLVICSSFNNYLLSKSINIKEDSLNK